MNYIKYIQSADGTNLYAKVNEVSEPKANIIVVHGLAEHLERYDHITTFLNDNHLTSLDTINVDTVVQKESLYFIVIKMKLLKI